MTHERSVAAPAADAGRAPLSAAGAPSASGVWNVGAKPMPAALDLAFLTGADEVCELVLVRHGQQQWRTDGSAPTVGEIHDPPLSERGRRQAEAVGARFASERVDAVYSSHLARALDTGRAIARHHGLEPTVVEDLREIEVFNELPPDRTALESLGRGRLLGARARMARELRWDVYPATERSATFRHRVANAIEGIVCSHPGERVVVACHGGVINAYIAEVLGIRQDMFFRPAHTSVSILRAKDLVRALERVNDVHHLDHEPDLLTY
jgi:probable phosphoglycerate mutase